MISWSVTLSHVKNVAKEFKWFNAVILYKSKMFTLLFRSRSYDFSSKQSLLGICKSCYFCILIR